MAEASLASPAKKMKCATAVAETDWTMPAVIDIVVSFFAPNPLRRFNQMAIANRRLNLAWRRRMRVLSKDVLWEGVMGLLGIEPAQ